MPEETIGFIGLGITGRPMALNLLHAGYPLVVHNRTREKEQEIASQGAESRYPGPPRRHQRTRFSGAPPTPPG
ncbi:MAG: hypothetical protein JO304_13835 [Solirubrobacterales bacterium]|nr:hypothetical protein [Solirubrobacterales bacterium]